MSKQHDLRREEEAIYTIPRKHDENNTYATPISLPVHIAKFDKLSSQQDNVYMNSRPAAPVYSTPALLEKFTDVNLPPLGESETILPNEDNSEKTIYLNVGVSSLLQQGKEIKNDNASSSILREKEEHYVEANKPRLFPGYRLPLPRFASTDGKQSRSFEEKHSTSKTNNSCSESSEYLRAVNAADTQLRKVNSLAPSSETSTRNLKANDFENPSKNSSTWPIYMELSDETISVESTAVSVRSTASNEEFITSMGGKASKRGFDKKKRQLLQADEVEGSTTCRKGQNQKKHLSSTDINNSPSRPISKPPCDPLKPPNHKNHNQSLQIGQRPLPPTPLLRKTFSEEYAISSQYSCIDDLDLKVNRKSSMPTDPPPLPPVMPDVVDDITQLDHPPETKRPLTLPGGDSPLKKQSYERNFKKHKSPAENVQINEIASETNVGSPGEKSSQVHSPKQTHPIAQILQSRQQSPSPQRPPSGPSLSHNEELAKKIRGRGMINSTSNDGNITKQFVSIPKVQSPPFHSKSASTQKFNFPPKPSTKTTRAPDIPKKSTHVSTGDSPENISTVGVTSKISRPAMDKNSVSKPFEASKILQSPSKIHSKISSGEPENKANLASPKMNSTSKRFDTGKESPTNIQSNAFLNHPFKRIVDKKGYTLHKLQAERLDSQVSSGPHQPNVSSRLSFPQHNVNAESAMGPNVLADLTISNTYHVINDEIDKTQSINGKRNLISSMNDVENKTLHPSNDNGKSLSRNVSQTSSTSVGGTLSKSPKIKPKPRPTEPPPPKPTTPSVVQQNKAKCPPARPPPLTKQKIVEAKLRHQRNSANSSSNHSSPRSIGNRFSFENVGSDNMTKGERKSISLSVELQDDTYYSAIPDILPQSSAKQNNQKSKVQNWKNQNYMTKRKKFASAVTSVLTSRKNHVAKSKNEKLDSTADDIDGWQSDISSFDDDDDEEGIYAGIDDDYPSPQGKDDNVYLSSIPASYS